MNSTCLLTALEAVLPRRKAAQVMDNIQIDLMDEWPTTVSDLRGFHVPATLVTDVGVCSNAVNKIERLFNDNGARLVR